MKTLRLLSWNVNGIRAIHKKGFVDWVLKENPDILCLQETKAHPEQLPKELISINDYESFFSHSKNKKGYSGVAVYTKIKPQEVRDGFGIPKFDDEGRILILDYKDFILFNIYFPNGKMSEERLKYKMDFYDAFLEYCDNLLKQGRKLVICGDVNTAHKEIDLARPKENAKTSGFLPIERQWIDKFLSHGFVDTFRMFNDQPGNYTWWDMQSRARERNVGWRIDYFFVSENFKNNVKNAFILPEVMGSDHCPVGIEITLDNSN
ncbi:MAG: exodeoxyribonuclease III [Ignavibacterium album]|jgi:exodeoxyribonuclease-3|uniref:exodeoxyribonuclease III n=1 Tax=Ignavibacterium album TaxID=591197 RepID=UPI0026F0ECE6|nr:exodeoxyribonuclease III [Ignavibacterium album]MCX8106210.1 exodeoxyribonuclease III [Ignavibacterium album]